MDSRDKFELKKQIKSITNTSSQLKTAISNFESSLIKLEQLHLRQTELDTQLKLLTESSNKGKLK